VDDWSSAVWKIYFHQIKKELLIKHTATYSWLQLKEVHPAALATELALY
jgi:hypothetical protein